MEQINWTEIHIQIPTAYIEYGAAICQMVVPYGIYIEDYSDLITEAPKIAHIDLIDEELLGKDRTHGIIHVYISPDENPMEAVSFLETRFTAENIPYILGTDEVEEEKWATAWKQYYHPIRLGEHMVICPSWEECDIREGDIKIVLDPGMAFGTGTHHTTQLCLEQMEPHIKEDTKLLDMGCGSGILSIAGMLLGAGSAVAVDIDETAVRVCRENAALNGLDCTQYTALCGDLVQDAELRRKIGTGFDIITANIVADVIIALSPTFDGFLKEDGVLIASGIISERQADVMTAMGEQGFYATETIEKGGWVAMTLRKI